MLGVQKGWAIKYIRDDVEKKPRENKSTDFAHDFCIFGVKWLRDFTDYVRFISK